MANSIVCFRLRKGEAPELASPTIYRNWKRAVRINLGTKGRLVLETKNSKVFEADDLIWVGDGYGPCHLVFLDVEADFQETLASIRKRIPSAD